MSDRPQPARSRAFHFLLRAFPREFRQEYGSEMEDVFAHQQSKSHGPRAWLHLWLRTLTGVLRTAPAEHWSQLQLDFSAATRAAAKRPTFTAIAVLTLAFGIGANVLVFSLVEGVLLRPLPFPEPHQLVRVQTIDSRGSTAGFSLQDFEDLRDRGEALEQISAYDLRTVTLTTSEAAERIGLGRVSAGFFQTLGVRMVAGRTFLSSEDQPGAKPVAIISHQLWQRHFGGSRTDVIGAELELGNSRATVVGVAPADLGFPLETSVDAWMPLAMDRTAGGARDGRWIAVLARIRGDASLPSTNVELETIAHSLAVEYPETNTGVVFRARSLHRSLTAASERPLVTLWVAVGLVLLIAAVNVAGMLLARFSERRAELALRVSLGASRARLARLLMVESTLLAGTAGLIGIGFAGVGLELVVRTNAGSLPRLEGVELNAHSIVAAAVASVVAALLAGLAPTLTAIRSRLLPLVGGLSVRATTSRHRSRRVLVVTELAVTVVLVATAGLLVRSFDRLLDIDPGFAVEETLTFRLEPPQTTIFDADDPIGSFRRLDAERQQIATLSEQLTDALDAMPQVVAAGTINSRPLVGSSTWNARFETGDQPGEPSRVRVGYRAASASYFDTMGIPLLSGRGLSVLDTAGTPRVAVISKAGADALWPGQSAIGKRVRLDGDEAESGWHEIVGVVGDVPSSSLEEPPLPLLYSALRQARWGHFGDWGTDFVVRTSSEAGALIPQLRQQVASHAPGLPILEIRTFESVLGRDLAERRFLTLLLSIFGATAVALSAIGVYGVLAQMVQQRTRELGIRRAFGARPHQLVALVFSTSLKFGLVGLALGGLAAIGASRWLESMLFEIGRFDPLVAVATILVLGGSIALATALPCRRALSADPATALRTPE